MKNKVTLLNILSAFLLQFCMVISGFIIPKIILVYFGSAVNGLVSSINQFLSYITLVEGGITGVIIANLYEPLVKSDCDKISSVMVTAKKFYEKIGMIFIGYTLILALVYPLIFRSEFSYAYVFFLIIILSIGLIIQYMFSITLKSLLSADKKNYIINLSQIAIVILNIILSCITIKIYPNIHILKFINCILYVIQPIIYRHYIDNKYKVDWNSKADNNLLTERWNGFAINLAAFIHNSTDIVILTIFTDLKTVSIYSVYTLVTSGLKGVINAITTGINPTIGHAYAKKNNVELNRKLDLYEYIVFLLVFYSFTLAALLTTSFVMLYTKGITDTNYYQPLFCLLIIISEALYLIKYPHLNLAYSANKFKEIKMPAYLEAIINIVLSILLVFKFKLIGVVLGTIIAMIYRMIFHVYYTTKIIHNRKQIIFYKKFIMFLVTSILGGSICCYFFPIVNNDIYEWISHAIIYILFLGVFYCVLSLFMFKNEMKYIFMYLKK